MTRPQEANLVRAAHGLRFLVLDELHTYRGRQGADVAMLVRRTREAMGAQRMQCVGTSATLASTGSWVNQQIEVSKAASLLFGSIVPPENVIGETLRRITDDVDIKTREFIDRLRERLEGNSPTDFQRFTHDPLSIWIETSAGGQKGTNQVGNLFGRRRQIYAGQAALRPICRAIRRKSRSL